MNVENRAKVIQSAKACINCLRTGHLQSQCFSRAACLICKKRHHSLLHNEPQSTHLHTSTDQQSTILHTTDNQQSTTIPTINDPPLNNLHTTTKLETTSSQASTTKSINKDTTSLHQIQSPLSTLLPTALIYIQSSKNQPMLARALLDSGSQSSFISESCIQRLGLRRKYSNIQINGLASSSAGKTIITISSRVIPHYTIQFTAHIIEKISSPLPATMIHISQDNEIWQHQLADPQFNIPSAVDLLIGAEFFLDMLGEQKLAVHNFPVLHSSKFGWLIAGTINQIGQDGFSMKNYHVTANSNNGEENIMELLRKFWQVEELIDNSQQNDEKDPCEVLFQNTTTRRTDGRFVVKLPFKQPRIELGDSLTAATSRMLAIEKRFARSPEYQQEYQIFIKEYIDLKQMKLIPWSELPRSSHQRYFMPHHGIYKESTTTKLRVVFDASCKTTTAVSLNDCLHTGSKLQPDLTTTLLQFRQHAIAINADIEKMFRQILVDPADANFQCILWRDNPLEDLKAYKCMTVTYGTACAPFLAVRVLKELATNYELIYPEAAKAIRSHFYMDDLLTGSTTVENAIILKNQIIEILGSCGFRLRKWKSNSQEFLKSLTLDNTEDIPKLIEDDQTTKTLGIMWHPQRDLFTFKINSQPNNVIWTKRRMLSESSKLYDPLGWVSPIVIWFKILLQKLWLTKTDWDEEAPTNVLCLWNKIYSNLHYLQQITIPRCVFVEPEVTSIQLHAFCDASEAAYGCVIYIRASYNSGEITSYIVCSKSKVAPIKQLSLPRLELCGAVLLAELIKYGKPIFKIKNEDVYAWTDSMVVLHWLSDVPARWKTFIANRTSNILDIIPRKQWGHVASKQNPADYISRGVEPRIIPTLENWWHGPNWLKLNQENWPKDKTEPPPSDVDLEDRNKGLNVFLETEENNIVGELLTNYSSWFKIEKILAYIIKFCKTRKSNNKLNKGKLTYVEYVEAENFIIRSIQATHFKQEINKLTKKLALETNNVLSSLDPFIDSKGILRVGGRLRNSNLSYSVKHPIILPKNHRANQLIIQEVHTANLHAGVSLMVNLLRQKYWIIGARNSIKQHIKTCLICIRYRRTIPMQKMADLPQERCTKNRPFANTGIDYLGPIYVKMNQNRNATLTKAYVAVFVCLAVKAVHLELVSSLNTEAFLAALKRFVSRRGLLNQIWFDNGSNFIGANNELKRLKTEIIDQQNHQLISNFILQKGIEFKFNPASAPHFGGLWEAAVRSIKFHFRRATKEAKLNFEETTTLLTQIEGILNSRPLCRINDDSETIEPLTPGYFLIGESLLAVPEPLLKDIPSHKLSRWQNIQLCIQSFWKFWSRDYLNTLQGRSKWKSGNKPIYIDAVVLVKEDNLPPNQWLLGRIIQTHPGSDGIVRVATIKTKNSIIKRPVAKLIPLPSNENVINHQG